MNNLFKLLETKPLSSYPDNVLKEIKLVSYNKKEHAQPFGSYIYRIQKYPGDIDLLEQITQCNGHPCNSKEEVIRIFSKSFQNIVKDVVSQKVHYYSEIKCGLDKRYIFKIGDFYKGILILNSDFQKNIYRLRRLELITREEFEIMIGIAKKDHQDADDYDIISNILREHYILRWSVDEILDGIKELPGNKLITLEKALEDRTLCKIDMITSINGRFIEVTNVFGLGYYDQNGGLHMLNFTADPQILPTETEKLFYSNKYYSPFKAVKRIFSYARHEYLDGKQQYREILDKIIPLVTGNVSYIYQIKSELETILLIVDKFGNPSPKHIVTQISDIKNRLSNIIEIDQRMLIFMQAQLDSYIQTKDHNKRLEILADLISELKKYINQLTITYMNKVGLNQIPRILLPSMKLEEFINTTKFPFAPLLNTYHYESYNWNIVRTPVSNPKLTMNIKYDIELYNKSIMRKKGAGYLLPHEVSLATPLQVRLHGGYQTTQIVPQVRWNNDFQNTNVFYDPQVPLPQAHVYALPPWQSRQNLSYYPATSGSYSRNNYNDDIYSQIEVAHGVRQNHNQRNIF